MERLSESRSRLVPSSILSIVGGSLIIIGGLVPLGMLGMSGHYGMMSGTGGMMGGGLVMMMPLQSFIWTTVVSVISIVTGAVLIVGGYFIYEMPQSAGKWGIAILVASVVSIFGMGGFLIGPILGIIGGILALTKK